MTPVDAYSRNRVSPWYLENTHILLQMYIYFVYIFHNWISGLFFIFYSN